MIKIHRSQPLVWVRRRQIRLSRAEHVLLTTLGMMDNMIVPSELLIETALENPVKTPDDRTVLWQRIARLRKKIGSDRLQTRHRGYILVGDVHFIE